MCIRFQVWVHLKKERNEREKKGRLKRADAEFYPPRGEVTHLDNRSGSGQCGGSGSGCLC